MEIYSNPPAILEIIGWISLILAFTSALFICFHIFALGHRQKMWIMEVIYPINALYFGPLSVWFYLKYGEKKNPTHKKYITWSQISKGVFHCGAGCVLGDIIAAWLIFGLSITIANQTLYADFVLDFIFAWLLGIAFQYFTIAPMNKLSIKQNLTKAIKADTLSIIAFQIGLFLGMYIYQECIFSNPLPKTSASYWFLMQISMIIGSFTAYPVIKWLIRCGIKHAM